MTADSKDAGALRPRFWERHALEDLNRAEWEALLGQHGFELVSVTPTASPFDVLEARPVG